jgi:hypothetical protein
VVLSDAGFAPDRDGFTLALAADQAGSFLASGHWELLSDVPTGQSTAGPPDAPDASVSPGDDVAREVPQAVAAPDGAWWDDEHVPAPAQDPERITDQGPFALGGWAPQPGATAVHGITFSHALTDAPDADRVRLRLRAASNVPLGGLVVLSDAGFAPDRDGFTLALAADQAGSFLASGHWELLSAD